MTKMLSAVTVGKSHSDISAIPQAVIDAYLHYREVEQRNFPLDRIDWTPSEKRTDTLRFNRFTRIVSEHGLNPANTLAKLSMSVLEDATAG